MSRCNSRKNIGIALAACFVAAGCASTYSFQSTPEAVSVFHKSGGQRAFLGETPFDFGKSGLPTDSPFVLTFEKQGYETKDLVLTPTDNSRTMVTVTLRPGKGMDNDISMKRMRSVIKQIFAIQEHVSKKRYVDAIAGLENLEREEPLLAEVKVIKGSVYFMLRDYKQARTQWEKALELDPRLDDVKSQLVKLTELEQTKGKTQ